MVWPDRILSSLSCQQAEGKAGHTWERAQRGFWVSCSAVFQMEPRLSLLLPLPLLLHLNPTQFGQNLRPLPRLNHPPREHLHLQPQPRCPQSHPRWMDWQEALWVCTTLEELVLGPQQAAGASRVQGWRYSTRDGWLYTWGSCWLGWCYMGEDKLGFKRWLTKGEEFCQNWSTNRESWLTQFLLCHPLPIKLGDIREWAHFNRVIHTSHFFFSPPRQS